GAVRRATASLPYSRGSDGMGIFCPQAAPLMGPGHAVGAAAGLSACLEAECLQVEAGNVIVARHRAVWTRAACLYHDARGRASQFYALYFLFCGALEYQHISGLEVGDENQAVVGGELQAVRAFGLDPEGLYDAFGRNIDDRHGAVARLGGPQLLAV